MSSDHEAAHHQAPDEKRDPVLPCSVTIGRIDTGSITLSAGLKLSTLLHALELRGMERVYD